MVCDGTNACKDAKQLDVQKMRIYRPQNRLKEAGSLKISQRSG